MTIRAIADTHTVLWYLYDDPRLSQTAKAFLDGIDAAGDQIAVSSIALAEMIYLIEKGRIPAEALERVLTALDQPSVALVELPFDRAVAVAMRRVERSQVPELPDRIVAATGLHLGVPVISRDHKIRSSTVTTIWWPCWLDEGKRRQVVHKRTLRWLPREIACSDRLFDSSRRQQFQI